MRHVSLNHRSTDSAISGATSEARAGAVTSAAGSERTLHGAVGTGSIKPAAARGSEASSSFASTDKVMLRAQNAVVGGCPPGALGLRLEGAPVPRSSEVSAWAEVAAAGTPFGCDPKDNLFRRWFIFFGVHEHHFFDVKVLATVCLVPSFGTRTSNEATGMGGSSSTWALSASVCFAECPWLICSLV